LLFLVNFARERRTRLEKGCTAISLLPLSPFNEITIFLSFLMRYVADLNIENKKLIYQEKRKKRIKELINIIYCIDTFY